MTRWTHCCDDFSDRRFYYEIGDDGLVLRQVELRGPESKPTAAAVKAEWLAALHAGTADDYYAVFGSTADMPVHVWEEPDLEDITAEEFERIWATARAACEARMADPEPSPQAAPFDSAWLTDWRRDVDSAVAKLLAGFEERFGYPPGEDSNAVRDPSPEDLAAANRLSENPLVAPALVHFYRHVGRVDLADVGNGYFIHPATSVLEYLPDSDLGAFFASDGGGIHYVIGADGAVHRSSAASLESDFVAVATDLQEFLDRLRNCVIGFLATGEPGNL